MNTDSKHWVRQLTALPATELIALADQLSNAWRIGHVSLPQTGLGMLKLADGALEQPYNLGEFPVSVCHLQITLPSGATVQGAAQVMSDDAALAQALAIFDAILRHSLPGQAEVEALRVAGKNLRAQEDRARNALLSATRVDFSELSEAGDDDEND